MTKMTKTNKSCPICSGQNIVVKINKIKQEAWPSCWKCGFEGHSEGETKALLVLIEGTEKNEKDILKEASQNWNEYLLLLEEEKEDNNG